MGEDSTILILSARSPKGNRGLSPITRAPQNFTPYNVLSLRVGVGHHDPANAGGQDFRVALVDADGQRAERRAGAYSDALFYPPGRAYEDSGSRNTVLNMLAIPLQDFSSVDLGRIVAIELIFNERPAGSIQINDLQVYRALDS